MKDYLIMILSWVVFFISQFILVFVGLFAVAIGLLFRKTDESTRIPFTLFNTNRTWVKEDIPNWLKPFTNLEDGLRGDTRGWWDLHSFGSDSSKLINMYWWSAIRNPTNYFKRFTIGCDIRDYTFSKLKGVDYVRDDLFSTGFQILKATPKSGSGKIIPRYMLYYVKRHGNSSKAIVIQIGNKIKLSHNTDIEKDEFDYFKGFTTEVNPFKDIS